jgi:small subunit ribosomal protein S6
MKRHYETVFIATPVLSEDQMKETVEKFRSLLQNNDAEIVHEEDWGLRKLAYPIDKKSTGFYHLIEFEAEGQAIDTLEIEFKRDERILRFLTVKMDKYAVEYAEKRRREKSTNTQQSDEQKTKEE